MMKAAILAESLTGNTWKAAEMIGSNLQQEGWTITGLSKVKAPDHASIQAADIVLVGTWTHGLFVVGQAPWAAAAISNLPAMRGKQAAVFLTFALNAGKSLERLSERGLRHRRRRGRWARDQAQLPRSPHRGVREPPHRRGRVGLTRPAHDRRCGDATERPV